MTVSSTTDLSRKRSGHYRLPIVEHAEVGLGSRRLVLDAPELAQISSPGQFVHVLCTPGSGYDPLLRRPLSVHDADPKLGRVFLLYEIRGRGTALLAEKLPGETLDVLGPLGQGFTLPESGCRGGPVVLVAGGVAVAPICFLARRIKDVVGCDCMTFLIGARTESLLLCVDELSGLGCDVRAATDDGSAGYHGMVTDLLERYIREMSPNEPPIIYACGPTAMLRAVAEMTSARGLRCQVSLEAKMACGVGACMSCVVRVRSGDSPKYVRVCKEGPVFSADEVVW